MTFPPSFVRSLAVVSFGVIAQTSHASFTLFENFDSLNTGPLSGQGGWIGNTVTTVLDTGGGDKVANLATGGTGNLSNYRSLGGLTIPNSSSAAALYWNFTISSVATNANNWNFIVTDVAAPGDTAGSSEVQFNYDSTQPAIRARNAGNFLNLTLDGTAATRFNPLVNTQYNAWFQINNTTDTYTVYLQSSGDPLVATPTQMIGEGGTGTFTFRNSGSALAANDLTTVNFGSASSGSVVRFDDIYVDTAGTNLTIPVPEPGAAALLGLGGLGLILRRRRTP